MVKDPKTGLRTWTELPAPTGVTPKTERASYKGLLRTMLKTNTGPGAAKDFATYNSKALQVIAIYDQFRFDAKVQEKVIREVTFGDEKPPAEKPL